MSNLEIVKPAGGALARPQQGFDIESVFRYALEKNAGPEAMTTLMSIRRELNAEAAKKAFDEAMSSFQDECPVIIKTKGVPTRSGDIAYKYAPVEQIETAIRPVERKHGFSHTFDTDVSTAPGWVIAKCIITHCAGHVRESQIKLPLGVKTQIMSDTQVYAGAMTFANRRALANAYGLVIAGEDQDGAGRAIQKPQVDASEPVDNNTEIRKCAQELWGLLKAGKVITGTEKNWQAANNWLWREEILDAAAEEAAPNLSQERFRKVIEAVRNKNN